MANMHKETPNHDCRDPDNVSFSTPTHAHRQSVYGGSESGLATSAKERQKQQVAGAQDAEPPADPTGMAYSPAQAPTPLPESDLSPPSPMILTTEPTDEDIAQDIAAFLNEEMDGSSQHQASWCFEHADQRPPITPESLAELDMPRIINNPKLRHDVNFDRELHFRPNLDGSKGRQKILQADQYWKALEAELVMHRLVHIRKAQSPDNEAYWNRIMKASLLRLPKIFAAIRDILKTLVPDYDQKSVLDRLDVDHIMQQIHNGVCDLIDLGNWLAKVLKNHCAPMRDPLVDAMQKDIRRGAAEGRHDKLVSGLRQLMNILEAMKLDVANHQIRHMRPLLIDDTVNFQRRYNAHRIAVGKISVAESRSWIQDCLEHQPSYVDALAYGLIRDILLNESANMCPPTFYLDVDRIRALRVELHSRVYYAICQDVLKDVAPSGISASGLTRAFDMLHSSVSAIVGTQGRYTDRLENIAVEIVRVLQHVDGRGAPFDLDLLNQAESRLVPQLRADSTLFKAHADVLVQNLVPKVQARIRHHARLTALDLQDILVPAPATSNRNSMGFGAVCEPAPTTQSTQHDADDDIIRRFTHIISLHWQVWSELAYATEDSSSSSSSSSSERGYDSGSEHGSDSTMAHSATGSPKVSAVYAPGRKWMPANVTVTDMPNDTPPAPTISPQPVDEDLPDIEPEQDDAPDTSHQQSQST
jgi:hypothetical protein